MGLGGWVDDGTVAIAAALPLFLYRTRRCESGQLMDWETAKKLPWHFGGGFALAKGFMVSGLSEWTGHHLMGLGGGVPVIVLILIIALMVTFMTEVTSNTATTRVILPLLAAMAIDIDVHPLQLMIPATISASCAFMMPIATPPNAIVFGTDRVPIAQMARLGFLLNLTGAILITLIVYWWGSKVMPV